MTIQTMDFAERIRRIESGAGSSKATLYVGDEIVTLDRNGKVKARPGTGLRELLSNAVYPMTWALACATGFAAHGVATYARFQMSGLKDRLDNPDREMAVQLIAAFCVAVVFSYLVRLRAKELLVPKIAGVVLGVTLFHNFVHLYPDLFGQVFSPMWVSRLVSSTTQGSLLWRGVSFTF